MKHYTIEEIMKALTDIMDGNDERDIETITGLSIERCKEIKDIANFCQIYKDKK